MAKEVLVTANLSEEMIQAGKVLVEQLKMQKFKIEAAFWWRFDETGAWRFIVASPAVRAEGPRKVYRKLQTIIAKTPEDQVRLSLTDISVIDPKESTVTGVLVKAFKQVTASQEPDVAGIFIHSGFINAAPVEDAYIYRLN